MLGSRIKRSPTQSGQSQHRKSGCNYTCGNSLKPHTYVRKECEKWQNRIILFFLGNIVPKLKSVWKAQYWFISANMWSQFQNIWKTRQAIVLLHRVHQCTFWSLPFCEYFLLRAINNSMRQKYFWSHVPCRSSQVWRYFRQCRNNPV